MSQISSASPAFTGNDPENRLFGPLPDVTAEAGYEPDHPARVGFFTDTSVCIGCKACEVACKEWNTLPMDDADGTIDALGLSGMSYDNTGMLGANSWRHVAFVEQSREVDLPMPGIGLPAAPGQGDESGGGCGASGGSAETLSHANADGATIDQADVLNAQALSSFDPQTAQSADREIRWLMSSDVCKHCTHAGCLDVCPTGALFRTEQRLRLLRAGLPVRRDRPAEGRRPGLQVHDVLRPADRRSAAGLRDRVPDPVDPVR
ncbi:hypothetical protein GCM10023162_11080 [Klenkia terrae]